MKHLYIILSLLIPVIGFWGCSNEITSPVDTEIQESTQSLNSVYAYRNLESRTAQNTCLHYKLIGIKKDESKPCPVPSRSSNWNVKQMFEGSYDSKASRQPVIAKYCLYENQKRSYNYRAIESLKYTAQTRTSRSSSRTDRNSEPKLLKIVHDCIGIAPMSIMDNLANRTNQIFKQQFEAEAGFMTNLPPVDVSSSSPLRDDVSLSIIDSFPTYGSEMDPHMQTGHLHGSALINFAKDALCKVDGNSQECLADVDSQLGIKYNNVTKNLYRSNDIDDSFGGTKGSFNDIANAMYKQFNSIINKSKQLDVPVPRMVFNFSFGWSGGYGSDFGAISEQEKVVLDIVEYLNCAGVLMVAAAGNNSSEALYPGAWETRRAKSNYECSKINPKYSYLRVNSYSEPYNPILWSAQSLQSSGKKLAIASVEPPLATYGEGAVTVKATEFENIPQVGLGETAVLSGSSVSSLVLSAIASSVIKYRPSLSNQEIMTLIYLSAIDLKRPADYCLKLNPAGCPKVKRASLCSSIKFACKYSQGNCPKSQLVECDESTVGNVLNFEDFDFEGLEGDVFKATLCGADGNLSYPDIQSTPSIHTQPMDPVCPSCIFYSNNNILYFDINSDYGSLSNGTVTLTSNNSTSSYTIGATGGDSGTVNVTGSNVTSATLSFTTSNNMSVTSPLIIGF